MARAVLQFPSPFAERGGAQRRGEVLSQETRPYCASERTSHVASMPPRVL
jgi:hypothetical protein